MFPDLPQIQGDQDIYLDIGTHKPLRRPTSDVPDYGDADRLALLGKHVMKLVVTQHLFSQRPLLSADKMKEKQQEVLHIDNYRRWIQYYKLRLISSPDISPLEDDAEAINFFDTYVGAVYFRNGIHQVIPWVLGLLNPYGSAAAGDTESSDQSNSETASNPPSYTSQQYNNGPNTFSPQPGPSHSSYPHPQQPGFSAGPSPPAEPAPPLPAGGPPPSLPNGVSSLLTLAVVNQTVAQRGMVITYEPNPPVGPAHSPIWTVRCMINGIERGRGQGKSQKLAKEEAARQAWVNMGW